MTVERLDDELDVVGEDRSERESAMGAASGSSAAGPTEFSKATPLSNSLEMQLFGCRPKLEHSKENRALGAQVPRGPRLFGQLQALLREKWI